MLFYRRFKLEHFSNLNETKRTTTTKPVDNYHGRVDSDGSKGFPPFIASCFETASIPFCSPLNAYRNGYRPA